MNEEKGLIDFAVEHLAETGGVTIPELAAKLKCSEHTASGLLSTLCVRGKAEKRGQRNGRGIFHAPKKKVDKSEIKPAEIKK